jgi:hypothetical protein
VNNEILLAKFEFYSINGVTRKLIKSYLTDRHQRTLINNNSSVGVSDWQKVKQGVPQGSILGPLIFLIYINDLPHIINKTSKQILNVDDTSILCVNSNPNELVTVIKGILGIINEQFSINSLSLDKTNCVQFSSTPNIPNNIYIHYDDTQIHNTCNTTSLGLVTDSTLSWKEHISQGAIKMSSAGYAITALSLIMSQESLLMTCYAYAHSIMSYGIFWGNSTHSNQIFKIKNK